MVEALHLHLDIRTGEESTVVRSQGCTQVDLAEHYVHRQQQTRDPAPTVTIMGAGPLPSGPGM
jgi:hypothetical protein